MIAKGYTQREGFDYQETFSLVAKITIVQVFLALAATNSLHLSQFDVKNTFLHRDLDEEIYMELSPGFILRGRVF